MPFNFVTNIESCYIAVPHLLYYSHIPTAVIALIVGFFVYYKNRGSGLLISKVLLFSALFFSLWSIFDIIIFIDPDSRVVMFFWSLVNLVEMLVTTSTLYFTYLFFEKKDVPIKYKVLFGLLLSVFTILIPTAINLMGFDGPNCEANQGPLIYYFYSLEIFSFFWLIVYLIRKNISSRKEERKMTLLFSIGVILFLASFSGANIFGSLTEQWEILQYGLFGMPIFMAFLAYLIIRYKVFNVKLVAAQALVIGMIILIASQFFFINNPTNKILNGITLVLVTFFGLWLVKSVKKEVKQREELEKITNELKIANLRLQELDQQKTEFLSIATHQLRTPLSIIKGYIELIKDGAYGKPSTALVEVLDNMEESNERLVKLVDEFLDITRIEQGRTKFTFTENDLIEVVKSVVTELEARAEDKGFDIEWQPKVKTLFVSMDDEKVRHVIFNYVDNAIKYGSKGKIKIAVVKEGERVKLTVNDSGFGFDKKDEVNFFQKFYRGENVKDTNVNGTGLGLFVCRKFIESHGGEVWAHSPGLGKGSEFGFWIPLKQNS